MTEKTLCLIFDPSLPFAPDSTAATVLCSEETPATAAEALTLREFLKEDYPEKISELGLWWLRQLGVSDHEGVSLHRLFEWEGESSLWFTPIPFLYPEQGVLRLLSIAWETLRRLDGGEYAKARLLGEQIALEQTIRANGFNCETVTTTSLTLRRPATSLAPFLLRSWLVPRLMRWRGVGYLRSNPSEAIFYSVVRGEWRIPGDGEHRYLAETLEEILEIGAAREVRPLLFGIPPVQGDTKVWRDFLSYSTEKKGGVYPLTFLPTTTLVRVKQWAGNVSKKLEAWLKNPPEGFGRKEEFDLFPLIHQVLKRSLREAAKGVLLYEAIKETLKMTRPKALLIKDEVYPHGRIFASAARAAGVRSVSLQHGSIYLTHWCYLMDPVARGLEKPPLPDVLGVYGISVAEMLQRRLGFPGDVLKIVGARRFRSLRSGALSPEIVNLNRTGAPIVLLAGQLTQDMSTIYEWMFDLAGSVKDAIFLIKPHPRDRDRPETLKLRCERMENCHYFDGPLHTALPACALAVSGHSTVLLEAIWLKIGALSVQISGQTPEPWQTESGLVRIVRTQEELSSSIMRAVQGTLFSDQDRIRAESFLEDHLGYSQAHDPGVIRQLFEK